MAGENCYAALAYAANGGSGAPATETKSSTLPNDPKTFTVSSTKPSRQYYDFLGWANRSTATAASYQGGSTITINTASALGATNTKVIYAVWKRSKITVKYNANGGSGAPASQTVNMYEWFNLSSTIPTRTGYTFQGWEYGGNVYAAGSSARFTASVTLSASWAKVTYTISYNGNGNTGGTVPSNQTKEYGTALTLSSSVPTRTNYTFLGWSTSNTATEATYQAGGTYTANAGATLYAVWQLATRTYTLTYNANSGSGAPSAQTSESTTASSYTFTVSATQPTRTGYDFMGWSTTASGSVEYNYPMSITVTDNTTLYAVWALKTYTVSYNANGGSGVPVNQTKQYGVNLTLSSVTPTRDGYTFQGWATSAGGTVAYSAGGTYTDNASITLYAVWQVITYTISYNANGGSNPPSSQTKTYGVALQLSGVVPTKSGYIFKGWDLVALADTVYFRPLDVFNLNSDTTLYAVWVQATYKSADVFVDGDSCEIYVKASGTIYGAELISI